MPQRRPRLDFELALPVDAPISRECWDQHHKLQTQQMPKSHRTLGTLRELRHEAQESPPLEGRGRKPENAGQCVPRNTALVVRLGIIRLVASALSHRLLSLYHALPSLAIHIFRFSEYMYLIIRHATTVRKIFNSTHISQQRKQRSPWF